MYTKGKWETCCYGNSAFEIQAEGKLVAVAKGVQDNKANAERICLCVNTHDDLLEACKDLLDLLLDKNAAKWNDDEKSLILAHLTEQFNSPQAKRALAAIAAAEDKE